MAWWIGTEAAILAAEEAATAAIVGEPEYRAGVEVPPAERVTARWAVPVRTAEGLWAIPACPDLRRPAGLAEVTEPVFPPEAP